MGIAARVLGVGDAFTARYWNASLVIESGDTRVLVDAPPALHRAVKALGDKGGPALSLDDLDHVVITHLHGDHVGGLEQLLFWRRFVTKKPCTLHAIPAVLEHLWDGRLSGAMCQLMDLKGEIHPLVLADYCKVEPLKEGPNAIGSLVLEWRRTVHHIPTSALRFTKDKASIAYSADTSFDRTLIDWLAKSDVYFHETNHGVHTPLASLVGLTEDLKKKMRLIHYPDEHDVERSPIACAREGDRVEV